jgi:fatty acid desaturase
MPTDVLLQPEIMPLEGEKAPSVSARLSDTRTLDKPRLLPMRELAADVRAFSMVSESRAMGAVAWQWAVIGGTVAAFVLASPHLSWAAWIPLYLLALLTIATRQHAFLALVHEATHYRLSNHRAWNDFLSDFFCAFPVGMCTDVYRRLHFLHHQHTNTQNDPDWVGMHMDEDWHWPKDHAASIRLFAMDLVGLGAHKILFLLFIWSPLQAAVQKHVTLSRAERIRFLGFLALVVTSLTLSHGWGWFFLLWIVPLTTFFGALVRLRSVAEHLVCPSEHELNETRHVDATWFERMTLSPLNVNYHLAHHLFPSVPWYNLPKLQRRLQQEEVFRQQAKITTSYLGWKNGVVGEILKPRSTAQA